MRVLIGFLAFAAAAVGDRRLPHAVAKLQARDLQGTASLPEQITRREPANNAAWRGLGFAYLNLNRPEEAIAAYLRAHEINPNHPTTLCNLGLSNALKGDRNRTPEWLSVAMTLKPAPAVFQ